MITSSILMGKVYLIISLISTDRDSGLPDKARLPGQTNVIQVNVVDSTTASRSVPGVSMNQPLPDNFTDYITNGAYASSPEQHLGFWFSGMQSWNGGEILYNSLDGDNDHVSVASRTFFSVDTTNPSTPGFSNLNFPDWLAPRAEAGLVWLPYGDQGVLLVIGGVTTPGDMYLNLPENATTTENRDGGFTSEIAVYDIAGNEWYLQKTLETGTGNSAPGQLASFCTVVAAAQDASSYSIYVYGGYDGTYIDDPHAKDEVWVLSVPAFQWTKVSAGTTSHRRKGHVCVSPNPTTMMSIGGAVELDSYLENDRSVDFFDLNILNWTGTYDPGSEKKYEIPDVITKQIGGSKTGFGTVSIPSGMNSTMTGLFTTSYKGALNEYQPYTCGAGKTPSKTKTPVIAGAAAGGAGALLLAALVFWLVRRHRKNKAGAARTEMRQSRVRSWFGKSSDSHDPEHDESHTSAETMVGSGDYFGIPKTMHNEIHEAPSNVTSPGLYNTPRHGTPYVTSPALSGSHEVDASSRHELMDHGRGGSMSIRDFPGYPRSIQGEFIMSARSESISHPSERLMAARNYGGVSPYELPQDKSNEDLNQPPNMSLNEERQLVGGPGDRKSFGINAEKVQSPSTVTPTSPIVRKPLNSERRISALSQSPTEAERPSHHRHGSSLSSTLPNLPSPRPEEDQRMSRYIESLPDEGMAATSHTYPQQQPRRTIAPRRSAYQENFDDMGGSGWINQ